MRSFLL